jgi:hypothetical protein
MRAADRSNESGKLKTSEKLKGSCLIGRKTEADDRQSCQIDRRTEAVDGRSCLSKQGRLTM